MIHLSPIFSFYTLIISQKTGSIRFLEVFPHLPMCQDDHQRAVLASAVYFPCSSKMLSLWNDLLVECSTWEGNWGHSMPCQFMFFTSIPQPTSLWMWILSQGPQFTSPHCKRTLLQDRLFSLTWKIHFVIMHLFCGVVSVELSKRY